MSKRPVSLSLDQIAALRSAHMRVLRRSPTGTWLDRGRKIPGNSVTSLARRGWIQIDGDRAAASPQGALLLDQISGRNRRRTGSLEGTSK